MLGYPTSLEDTPTLILQSFMSGTPASTQAVNAYWHFAGFALGQAYPHVAMGDAISLIHQDGTVLLSEDEFKAGLQSLSVVTTGDTPTRLQRRALRWALKRFDLKRLPATVHKDWMATGCPGSFEAMYHAKGRTR